MVTTYKNMIFQMNVGTYNILKNKHQTVNGMLAHRMHAVVVTNQQAVVHSANHATKLQSGPALHHRHALIMLGSMSRW